jgi:hypothetical protein
LEGIRSSGTSQHGAGPASSRQRLGRGFGDAGTIGGSKIGGGTGSSTTSTGGATRGKGAGDSKPVDPRVSKERGFAENTKRLRGLERTDPGRASDVIRKGRAIGVASDTATKVAIGVTATVGGGTGGFSNCFWDPCHTWPTHCHAFWNWWCSPGCTWWWSSCCCPWWGFGYWSGYWGFWGGYYPSYPVYYPVSYAAYPEYYPTVVYDSSDPAPAQTVYTEQPQQEAAPAAEANRGEGTIQAPQAPESSRGLQAAASQHLALGDEAFRSGRFSDAVHEYAKAVELQPDQGVLHLILSDALFATGDYHYSAYALRRALELDPTLVDSVVDKHTFYGDPAEFDRQLELLERYLADHFLDEDARMLLAANYLFGSKPSMAVDLLQSPSSNSVRDSNVGKLLLERANRALHQAPALETPR